MTKTGKNELQEEFIALRKKLIERDFRTLNEMQKKAVLRTEGPLLILAGAGSGKTTVLVSRIANIIKYGKAYHSDSLPCKITSEELSLLTKLCEGKLSEKESEEISKRLSPLLSEDAAEPWQILAITFTNKAANELKDRLALYLGEEDASQVWAGTFHSVCVRILRRYADRLGFSSHFTVYDTDDSKRVVKECQRLLSVDERLIPEKSIRTELGRAKDRLETPEAFASRAERSGNIRDIRLAEIYKLYQQLLLSADAMDFDDLIMNTVQLLKTDDRLREKYQRQFRYVHVDEYQDTNPAQYELTRLFAGAYGNICVVGDDDQSIYAFRGATVENILSFEKNYKDAQVIRLEENYRSTGNILNAANEVIKNNTQRKGKKLWTRAGEGEKITCFSASNESEEAEFIADEIISGVAAGRSFSDYAVLYRTNAQSSSVERAFVRAGIPYRVIGGKRFYERAEIRDAVAYLSVIANKNDSTRLKRIINVPKRGIGAASLNTASEIAAGLGTSLFDVISHADEFEGLKRAAFRLGAFCNMLNELCAFAEDAELPEIFDRLIEKTEYYDYLVKNDADSSEERIENLQELKSNMQRFIDENEGGGLSDFLEEVSLLSDIDSYNEQADAAVMMTLHSAKGLEFPVVFMAGMEENIFPGLRVLYEPKQLEEERRLAYVGITRAKEKLYMTNAVTRLLYGSTQRSKISRFAEEIPEEFKEERQGRLSYTGCYSGFYSGSRRERRSGAFGEKERTSGAYGGAYGRPERAGGTYGCSDGERGFDVTRNHDGSGRFGEKERTSGAFDGAYGRSERAGGTYGGKGRGKVKRAPGSVSSAAELKDRAKAQSYRVGDTVIHKAFGTGMIISAVPMGNDTLLEIAFETAGTKKLMANYARLKKA